jgi:diaminohydroxyphosphoribosylaminopyrimidine deaminase/5-amino-6-(5-phosphoribosylamino)uracil reductase
MDLNLKPGFAIGGLLERVVDPSLFSLDETLTRPLPLVQGSDDYWMNEALLESLNSVGISNPNPAVGCVIVKDGKEIARGHTQAYRGKHAERVAIEKLADPGLLEGATAYVTLERCSHQGNQPPCCDLLINSRLKRVVVGRGDPDPRVNGQGLRKLRENGKLVECGILTPEITAWNLPFFATRARARPLVALKWAQTLDGQFADDTSSSQWISGKISRSYTHWLRQRYDAILVGAKTFLADVPSLSVRDCASPIQHQPLRLIWDPSNLIDARRGLAIEADRSGFILRDNDVSALMKTLQIAEMQHRLGRPLQSLMVEGGPGVLTSFIEASLADVIHAFIAPKITGGKKYRLETDRLLSTAHEFKTVAQAKLGSDLLFEMISPELEDIL